MVSEGDEGVESSSLRVDLLSELQLRGIRATPQSIAAMMESLSRAPGEIAGDSDSLLLGLLYSGSYTVDVLENAGLDAHHLRRLTRESVLSAHTERASAMTHFFSEGGVSGALLSRFASSGDVLETAHILEAAISPVPIDSVELPFPIHLRKDRAPQSSLHHDLERGLCELISYAVSIVAVERTADMLSRRTTPLRQRETETLRRDLIEYHEGITADDVAFIVNAVNGWLTRRHIVTDPPQACLQAITRCAHVAFGPALFSEAGGNLKAVEAGLRLASRFSPERDLAELTIINRDGHLHVAQMTYRNLFAVESSANRGPPRPVSLQSSRPAGLISQETLTRFEALIDNDNATEAQIQSFLEAYPEILQAVGYASARPHLCLREDGKADLIPDFVLQLPGVRGIDILDLKLPDVRLVSGDRYRRMSMELTKALAQLRRYGQFFERVENRRDFSRRYGLEPFKPELTVVVGRSTEFADATDRIEIEGQLGDVRLFTYDDLIAYAKERTIETRTLQPPGPISRGGR